MHKSHCEKSLIRDEAKMALNLFVQNLNHLNISYMTTCNLCYDKNMSVAEKSVICLAKLI